MYKVNPLFPILFFAITWQACRPIYSINHMEKNTYVMSDSVNNSVDSSIYTFISPYKEKMQREMNVILAESEMVLEKGNPEGPLGNFVADVCLKEASKKYFPADSMPIDFAVFNNGGLRRPLPYGKITRQDVFELMPFENELVILTLNGETVKKIFNFIASKDGAPVSGLRFQILNKQAINISIHELPFDSTKTYKVLTSDYLANGGDSFNMFIGASRESINLKMRDALINYLSESGKLDKVIRVNIDGRITYAK
jgi:2',3'-cyclic-nucleotide 2'-phosphodiesterase (5'-nucleotidase family)